MEDYNSIYTGAEVDDYLTKIKNLRTINLADAATEGGVIDCTTALQDILDSEGNNVCITIPQGDWLFEGDVESAYSSVYIRGAASRATKILYEPSAAGVCFNFNSGALPIQQAPGGCFDMSFWSADDQYKKTAIKFNDGSNFDIRDITIGGTHPTTNQFHWTDVNDTSIGIDGYGREVIELKNIRVFADNPVVFGPTLQHANLDCDQFHLNNTYLVAPKLSENSLITVRDKTELKNFTIDGYNAWARGRCGVFWESTLNDSVSFHVKFSGIRCEQGEDAGGETYSIYIDHNVHNIEWMVLEQIRCDLGRKHGIFIRGADDIRMEDIAGANGHASYVPVQGAPLEIQHNSNNTCKALSWTNCSFGHYGGTSVIPEDLMLVKGVDNPNALCDLPLHATYVKKQLNTYQEEGKLVAEDLRLIRFARTIVAPQTGQATIDATAKTITAISGFDFSEMDYDTLIYLDSPLNADRFYTLESDSTGTVLHILGDTMVNETNATMTIVHGMGLFHRANLKHVQKISISLYAENEAVGDRLMHLEFMNGKAAGTKNVTIHETHPTDFYVDPYPASDKVPPSNAFTVFGETQPIRVWNNRTVASNAKLIIEQLNF